ncbi:MAG TPA: hypothetical protein VE993_01685 [Stellaceae bacterium]|nr:hypothetical protein [Stellaceae bacterium]
MRQRQTAPPREAIRVAMGADGILHLGPTGHIRIDPGDPLFVDAVIADLGHIADTAEGRTVLEAGAALGRPLVIAKPQAATRPPNAWIVPADLRAATRSGVATGIAGRDGKPLLGNGAGCGGTICYDPADWPRPGDAASPTGRHVLLALLRHANVYAAGAYDPTRAAAGEEE